MSDPKQAAAAVPMQTRTKTLPESTREALVDLSALQQEHEREAQALADAEAAALDYERKVAFVAALRRSGLGPTDPAIVAA